MGSTLEDKLAIEFQNVLMDISLRNKPISLGMYEQYLPMMPQNPESLCCDYRGHG